MKNKFINYLRNYINLSEKEQKLITDSIKIVHVDKKDKILQEGKINRYDYFIVKGALKLYFINDEGVEKIVFIGIENYWIGDLAGYYNHKSNFYIEAIDSSILIRLPYETLEELNNNSLNFASINRQLIINSYNKITNRLVSLLNDSAVKRFEKLMINEPHLVARIPHKILASYIGISAEYFSKNLSKWKMNK